VTDAPVRTLVLSRCGSCQLRYLPRDAPCPRCGANRAETYPVPPDARVLAATELSVPPPGWTAPHHLLLAEVADGVRVLAVARHAVPPGGAVRIEFDGTVYRATPTGTAGRGEGESPKARSAGPSFEPPR